LRTEDGNTCSASFFMPKRRLLSTYIYMEVFIIKSTYYWDFLLAEHLTLIMAIHYDAKMLLVLRYWLLRNNSKFSKDLICIVYFVGQHFFESLIWYWKYMKVNYISLGFISILPQLAWLKVFIVIKLYQIGAATMPQGRHYTVDYKVCSKIKS